MCNIKNLCGIVTYNPEMERLYENISAIYLQVDQVIIVDNGSKNIDNIKDMVKKFNKDILIIELNSNYGIATALKKIMDYADKNEYKWVLTLDQDSVCNEDIIKHYMKYIYIHNIGMLTCNIIDRNFKENNNIVEIDEIIEIPMCITSAAFVNVDAYNHTAGYDEKMFIDWVDFDICIQLRNAGYKIMKVNYDGLLHEVGNGKNVKIFGKQYIAYNHSSFRQYYMARNHFYVAKKYPNIISLKNEIKKEIRFWIIIILFERNKVSKLLARCRGMMDVRKLFKN